MTKQITLELVNKMAFKKTASYAVFNLGSVNSAKSRTKLMETRKKKTVMAGYFKEV